VLQGFDDAFDDDERALVGALFGTATLWVGFLHNNAEVKLDGYARVPATLAELQHGADIPTPAGHKFGALHKVGVWDASTRGNLLCWAELPNRTVSGDSVRFTVRP
jgi:hypothetical protein